MALYPVKISDEPPSTRDYQGPLSVPLAEGPEDPAKCDESLQYTREKVDDFLNAKTIQVPKADGKGLGLPKAFSNSLYHYSLKAFYTAGKWNVGNGKLEELATQAGVGFGLTFFLDLQFKHVLTPSLFYRHTKVSNPAVPPDFAVYDTKSQGGGIEVDYGWKFFSGEIFDLSAHFSLGLALVFSRPRPFDKLDQGKPPLTLRDGELVRLRDAKRLQLSPTVSLCAGHDSLCLGMQYSADLAMEASAVLPDGRGKKFHGHGVQALFSLDVLKLFNWFIVLRNEGRG